MSNVWRQGGNVAIRKLKSLIPQASIRISVEVQRRLACDWKRGVQYIDTTCMACRKISKLSTLIDELEEIIPDDASQHIPGAYLCLQHIPVGAIVEDVDRTEIE